ncbi:MAG: acyltransferase [Eubacteriales bacterium]|nr:acyltransferase [Eubacteriales bacterium]
MNRIQEGKKRNSTFELLRIAAMFLIIGFHIWNSAIRPPLDRIMREGELFNSPMFYSKLLVPEVLAGFGSIGNNLFILISGFFMAASGKKFRLGGKIGELLKQLGFAVVLMLLVSAAFVRFRPDLNVQTVVVSDFNEEYWFLGYYIAIIVLADLFLNRFLETLSRDSYRTFLLVLFAAISIGWIDKMIIELSYRLHELAAGVFFFCLGGYLRKYEPFRNVRAFVLTLTILACYGLAFFSYRTQTLSLIQADPSTPFLQIIPSYSTNSILIILISVAGFERFRRLRVPDSRAINFLGKGVFMVYAVHENRLVWNLWSKTDWVRLLYDRPGVFCLRFILCILCTFGICILAYVLYLGFIKACGGLKRCVLRGDAEAGSP